MAQEKPSDAEKKERAKLAQAKYRAKLEGEGAERDNQNRIAAMRKYREKKLKEGIRPRSFMLSDADYQKVKDFLRAL